MQGLSSELIRFGMNYGFAGLIAIMFWRFITRTQKEQTELMGEIGNTLTRIEKQLDRLES